MVHLPSSSFPRKALLATIFSLAVLVNSSTGRPPADDIGLDPKKKKASEDLIGEGRSGETTTWPKLRDQAPRDLKKPGKGPEAIDRGDPVPSRDVDSEEGIQLGRDKPQVYFPSCVMVESDTGWDASGVLIAPRLVLTAKHVFVQPGMRVFLGEKVGDRNGKYIKVVASLPYDETAEIKVSADLRLLLLASAAPEGFPPVKLASPGMVPVPKRLDIAGFGKAGSGATIMGIKRSGELQTVDSIECAPPDDVVFGGIAGFEFVASDSKYDTLKGDSGGPVYLNAPDGVQYLIGITSRSSLADASKGIYARVDKFRDWIKDSASKMGVAISNR